MACLMYSHSVLPCTPLHAAEMTSDVLVIIEPGTPAGFHHVREARSQVRAQAVSRLGLQPDAVTMPLVLKSAPPRSSLLPLSSCFSTSLDFIFKTTYTSTHPAPCSAPFLQTPP